MRVAGIALTVFVTLTLQVTFARFTVGGRWVFDLVLVGVVFAALLWGPVAGMLTGTFGGLIQDLLSGGVVGVGGLAKTLVGYAAGVVGAQFVLARPSARMLIVAVGSVVHRLALVGLNALIDQRWSGVPWTAILVEMLINSGIGLIVFQILEAVPGAIERGRMSRRSTFSRRNW
jgi:rod shape-determining protein MreD